MNDQLYNVISIDFPAVTTALCAAISCALLGNFLLLRRLSLMGDSIAHSVLPGIVAAFLFFSSRASVSVFIGAAVAGVLSAGIIELIKKLGRIEEGAAMGVVFSAFFALGVLMMEQAAARAVDLDADCLLHGQLESVFWLPPQELAELFRLSVIAQLPAPFWVSIVIAVFVSFFVVVLYKELAMSSFDPQLSNSLGFSAQHLHYGLMIVVAFAVVASFQAVGSILVIAMLVCPAAIARLYTDRLQTQCWLSVFFAALGVLGGYLLAVCAPEVFGWEHALSSSGMMTVSLGGLLLVSIIFAPAYGILARKMRQQRLAETVVIEDVLANLYRLKEPAIQDSSKTTGGANAKLELSAVFSSSSHKIRSALKQAQKSGLLTILSDSLELTQKGEERAKKLLRTHRLWETYLVEEAGLREDHVHSPATKLEHFTEKSLAQRLADEQQHPGEDPHGKKIPSDEEGD